jgi:hypothetical protein
MCRGQNLALAGLYSPYSLDSRKAGYKRREVVQAAAQRGTQSDQIVSFNPPGSYHRSPDTGELQCTSKKLKEII